MRTLHTAYRVTDVERSLVFYNALGFEVIGRVDLGNPATLTVLKLDDEPVASLELVYRPERGPVHVGTGFSHIVIQVEDLTEICAALVRAGIAPEQEQQPGGPDGPRVSWLSDPDGYRIELVQWPPGHADGLSAADFA